MKRKKKKEKNKSEIKKLYVLIQLYEWTFDSKGMAKWKYYWKEME